MLELTPSWHSMSFGPQIATEASKGWRDEMKSIQQSCFARQNWKREHYYCDLHDTSVTDDKTSALSLDEWIQFNSNVTVTMFPAFTDRVCYDRVQIRRHSKKLQLPIDTRPHPTSPSAMRTSCDAKFNNLTGRIIINHIRWLWPFHLRTW